MMYNFIIDFRKGCDFLKSYQQNDLVNKLCSFTFKP